MRGGRRDETIVSGSDQRKGTYVEIPAEPYLALDVYYHPFAYLDFSSVADPSAKQAARILTVQPHTSEKEQQ